MRTNTDLIGQSIKRKEDARFLTGAGQFTDDVTQPQPGDAVFLRSPHAHAKIRAIDTDGGEGRAGRGRGLHRRRPRGRERAAVRLAHHRASTARR